MAGHQVPGWTCANFARDTSCVPTSRSKKNSWENKKSFISHDGFMGLLYLPTWKVEFIWDNKVVVTILIFSTGILDSKTSYKLDWDRRPLFKLQVAKSNFRWTFLNLNEVFLAFWGGDSLIYFSPHFFRWSRLKLLQFAQVDSPCVFLEPLSGLVISLCTVRFSTVLAAGSWASFHSQDDMNATVGRHQLT